MATQRDKAPSTAERRAQAKLQRRQEIINAAIEVWAEKGSNGSGITEVAELAGMTHAGLLHHFGTKDNLRLAVIEERERRDRAVGSLGSSDDDLETIVAGYMNIARSNESHIDLSRLFISLIGENLAPHTTGNQYFRERYADGIDRMAARLKRAQSSGEVNANVDCDSLASEMYAFMDGALIQWLLNPQPGELIERYERYFSRLTEAIQP